jgi:2-methylcitrate dehydratase PrpD
MKVLQECVQFICRLRYADLPVTAVANAKKAIIDTMASMLAGTSEAATQKVLAYAKKQRSACVATIPGTSCRVSPEFAALVNGTMAHALDYDDVLNNTRSHPSAVVVPTIFAIGEDRKSSGQEIVTAYLAGLEAIDKIGSHVSFPQFAKGWHTTGTIGVFGAAAAAGKLIGLSEQEMTMAMGAVASMAGGLQKNFGTMTKSLHCGLAARSGILAATLAADGFTASEDILGDGGYLEVLAKPAGLLKKLTCGAPFVVVSPGLNVKCYPCCDITHRAIDAIFKIVSDTPGIDPQQIAGITCLAPSKLYIALIHDSPETGLQAKFSMQYCVAAALLDGRVDSGSFTDEMVQRPKIRAFMPKVRKVEDPSLAMVDPDGTDRRFIEVTVNMTDGRIFRHRIDALRGSGADPLNDEEIAKKFLECSTGVLPDPQQRRLLQMLQQLETVNDVSDVMQNAAVRVGPQTG